LGANVKFLWALLLSFSFLQPNSLAPDNLAEQAELAYLNGNYQEAVDLYEAVLSMVQMGDLYFNLGNAYYQLGDEGRALVNYSRAAEYMPRDEELRFNLALVRSRRVNSVVGEAGFWESVAASLKETITSTELAAIIIILWWASCGLFVLKYTRFRKHFLPRAALVLSVGLFVLMAMLGVIRFVVGSRHPSAVIVSENVQAMSGPSIDYLELFMLYDADEVRVIQREGDWVRVQLPDLREGWIQSAEVEEI
jgi:tetratricopeptide (TPR) repeat protein